MVESEENHTEQPCALRPRRPELDVCSPFRHKTPPERHQRDLLERNAGGEHTPAGGNVRTLGIPEKLFTWPR